MKIGNANTYAPLAQSVERRTVNPQVVGSSPTGGAKKNTTLSGGVLFGFLAAFASDVW